MSLKTGNEKRTGISRRGSGSGATQNYRDYSIPIYTGNDPKMLAELRAIKEAGERFHETMFEILVHDARMAFPKATTAGNAADSHESAMRRVRELDDTVNPEADVLR